MLKPSTLSQSRTKVSTKKTTDLCFRKSVISSSGGGDTTYREILFLFKVWAISYSPWSLHSSKMYVCESLKPLLHFIRSSVIQSLSISLSCFDIYFKHIFIPGSSYSNNHISNILPFPLKEVLDSSVVWASRYVSQRLGVQLPVVPS